MSFDITYPKMSSLTERGQIEELRSYLYQLVDQLKFELNAIDGGYKNGLEAVQLSEKNKKTTTEEAQAIFKSIKVKGKLKVNHIEHIPAIDNYSNKDFNELIYKTGYYIGTSAPSAESCTNYPIDETGMLEVISAMEQNKTTLAWWGFAYQTYRTHTGSMYIRSYDSSAGWTVWKKVTLT